MSDWFEHDTTMLFIGDSITDCGRRGNEAPLGSGYVRTFTELVTARWPERQIRWINKGISGNKVSDLRERWRDDVLFHKPERLSIKIGINDLHSHLRGAEGAVDPERFEELYDECLALTHEELNIPVVLLSPFYISRDTSGQTFRSKVLETLPRYIEAVERMSDKYDTLLVPLHDVFQEQLAHRDADSFCPEPVHPNHAGHTVIAENLLEVLCEEG
jgi:lysophospholipase L1-like esterase